MKMGGGRCAVSGGRFNGKVWGLSTLFEITLLLDFVQKIREGGVLGSYLVLMTFPRDIILSGYWRVQSTILH